MQLTLASKTAAPSFMPRKKFGLKVTGDPGAKVGLVAVDKGVYVLNNKHRLTQNKVIFFNLHQFWSWLEIFRKIKNANDVTSCDPEAVSLLTFRCGTLWKRPTPAAHLVEEATTWTCSLMLGCCLSPALLQELPTDKVLCRCFWNNFSRRSSILHHRCWVYLKRSFLLHFRIEM